jgi:hypothetical protein
VSPSPAPAAAPPAARPGLSGFITVEVSGALTADVAVAKEFSVEVTGDPRFVPLVVTRVKGDVLAVGVEENARISNPNPPLRVVVRAPVLRGVEVTGASEVIVSGLTGEGMHLAAHGASRLNARDARGEHVAIDASGASQVEVAGTVDSLVVDVSGASQVRARELEVRKAVVDVSGASTLQLQGQDVTGDASGASRLQVWGARQRLAVDSTGASSVQKM